MHTTEELNKMATLQISDGKTEEPNKMVTLQSPDGELFVIPRAAAEKSLTLKHMLEDEWPDNHPIPIYNVTSNILSLVAKRPETMHTTEELNKMATLQISDGKTEEPNKMVTLQSSDGELFVIPRAAAEKSLTLKHMLEDEWPDNRPIPIYNVTSNILSLVAEYMKKHAETDEDEELKSFDADFVKVDMDVLYNLIMAANYLNIKILIELTCKSVSEMIKGKSPEEIRKIFDIENDFTPAEEEKIQKEYGWAFKF